MKLTKSEETLSRKNIEIQKVFLMLFLFCWENSSTLHCQPYFAASFNFSDAYAFCMQPSEIACYSRVEGGQVLFDETNMVRTLVYLQCSLCSQHYAIWWLSSFINNKYSLEKGEIERCTMSKGTISWFLLNPTQMS